MFSRVEWTDGGSRLYPAAVATQTERSKTTRRAIIEAAYTAFEESGAPDVALEAIAERAGVTKGSIHYHFDNRVGLLAAVAIWVFQKIEARVAEVPRDPNESRAYSYIRALLKEQSDPVGRVLFTIGDELARTDGLEEVDPYKYLCAKLADLGVEGSVTVVAAAVMQLGRQLAFGQASAQEIDAMLEALCEGGGVRRSGK